MKPTTIRVKRTISGTYTGYVGREQCAGGMSEWEAKEWLCQLLESNAHVLSEKSDVGMAAVEAHKQNR